jgi:hypothetical protein
MRGIMTKTRAQAAACRISQGRKACMKHHKPVSKQPRQSATNLSILKDFMINLTDQIIEFVFEKTR